MSYDDADGAEPTGTPSEHQGFGSPGTVDPRQTTPAVVEPPQGGKAEKHRSLLGTVIETLLIIGAAFAIAMLVQTFMFRITGILQKSMLPTIEPGDRIIVNCLTYQFREPEAWGDSGHPRPDGRQEGHHQACHRRGR